MAQLGFAASLIGEGLTGKGILGQIGLEVILPSFPKLSLQIQGQGAFERAQM